MFDDLKILGSTERSIKLQTRLGRDIPNVIDPAPTVEQIAKFGRLVQKHPGWTVRREPAGGYNCVGHVWACRRTGIFDDLEAQIRHIQSDDGYRSIEQDEVMLGDLVSYWETLAGGTRRFIHVAQVVELRVMAGSSLKLPWVLSKLDATSGEVFHHFRDVAYDCDYLEYWSDRPKKA
jgi:hypothetical protein